MSGRKFKYIDRNGNEVEPIRKKSGKFTRPKAAEGYMWTKLTKDPYTHMPFENNGWRWYEVVARQEGDEDIDKDESSDESSSDDESVTSENFIVDDDNDISFKELYNRTTEDEANELYYQGREMNKKRKKKKRNDTLDSSGFIPSTSTSQPNILRPRKKKRKSSSSSSSSSSTDILMDYKKMYENCNNELNSLKNELFICNETNKKLGIEKLQAETAYENILKNYQGGRKSKRRKRNRKKSTRRKKRRKRKTKRKKRRSKKRK